MMKKIIPFIFLFSVSYSFAQKRTYVFENIIQYRIKSDFYSDFLNILSTKDYQTNLLITQTPMGNFATLKINDNLYSVYSESEENINHLKISFDGTKELLDDAFFLSDSPNLLLKNSDDNLIVRKENKSETILNKKCEVYTISNPNEHEEDKTDLCIDTKSTINTLPFINSSINLKGLVYRFGQKIILESIDTLENVLIKEAEEDTDQIKPISNLAIQFDEQSEIDEYKKQYNKK